jgi:hypothetical protein
MQAQVLQGQKQTNMSSPHNTEITKAGVPAGPVNKRSHGAPELQMNEQHEHMKTAGALWSFMSPKRS